MRSFVWGYFPDFEENFQFFKEDFFIFQDEFTLFTKNAPFFKKILILSTFFIEELDIFKMLSFYGF